MIENFLNSCRRHREMLRFSVLAIFIIWVVWQLHSSPYIISCILPQSKMCAVG